MNFYGNTLAPSWQYGFPSVGQPAVAASTILYLSSTANMLAGDVIEIMLDNGEFFRTTIKTIIASGQITTNNRLPARATAGNVVINITQSKNVLPDNEDFLT